ncbi:hypothetical protein DPMN_159670 [Dreissena polymorpha]|uniref:Uncharacterized protein n=1 Tax=Dreissena polymorpha TaxID=45954 RepID=A0A9D4ENQ5_DREPO|nr:hypothetical protein DPMN_159670 [Dreissena polymorpha]
MLHSITKGRGREHGAPSREVIKISDKDEGPNQAYGRQGSRDQEIGTHAFTQSSNYSRSPGVSIVVCQATNVLTKFHEIRPKIKKCPAHWPPYINKTNVLTNFHDDWAKIVTSRVFTRKTAPPTGGRVFQRTRTTFELNKHII